MDKFDRTSRVANIASEQPIDIVQSIISICKPLPKIHPLRLALSELIDNNKTSAAFEFLIAAGDRTEFKKPGRVLWKQRKNFSELAKLDPPSFITRVYRHRFHSSYGMTFAELRFADPPLYTAFMNWSRRAPKAKPESKVLLSEFGLLTRTQARAAKVQLIKDSHVLRHAKGTVTTMYMTQPTKFEISN